jgi:hypothetical protein
MDFLQLAASCTGEMITHKAKSDFLFVGSVIDFAMHEIGNVEPYTELYNRSHPVVL